MNRIKISDLTLREKIGQTACLNTNAISRKMGEGFDFIEYLKNNPFGSMWTVGFAKMDFVNMSGEWKNYTSVDYDIDKNIRQFAINASRVMKVPFLPAADAEAGARRVFPYLSDTPTHPAIGATGEPEIALSLGNASEKSCDLPKQGGLGVT